MTHTIQPSPVGEGERIHALDALRGIALLGILMVNMASFKGLIPIARAEFTIAPLLQVPPASRGEPRTGSVPPAIRGNLKEGVFNRACFCKLCPRDW